MPADEAISCPKHGSGATSLSNADANSISEIMANLPDNQGFPGRHKCAYCGYALGFDAGYAAALNEFEEHIQTLRD